MGHRERQGSGRVLTLSGNIYQQVSHYIKRSYLVMNNIWYLGSSKKKSAHSGWGGSENKWYPLFVLTLAFGAFVATV